ncbi:hypothetical protein [Hathewaya massiliensis]|nr:hypothetical protein [Hathewaya massiliensis]
MKTIMFCLFGLVSIILTILGFKKENIVLKVVGIVMVVLFMIMIASILK